jgi:hypothetical protein
MWKIINNYLKSLAMTIGYNLIYFFSYCQIKYNYVHNKLIYDVNHNKEQLLNVQLYDTITGIKNKKMSDYLNWKKENYDCMIITKDVGNYPHDNMIINKDSNFPVELIWNSVKYKFISLIVIISDNETYDVKLNSKKDNYYIVGNVIDKNFIKYYLEKYYKLKIKQDILYILQLIDYNMKINILDINKKITLWENEYVIN